MTKPWKVLAYIGQSAAIGLALAFIVVLLRPDLIGHASLTPTVSSFADAVAASSPAVATVFAEQADTGRGALGSAVVIDPAGYLVTNWHLVEGAAQIRVQLADGRVATAALVGADPDTELALLHIDMPDLPSIELGRSDTLEVGQVVLAIGNSLGFSQTVTMGIVSATGRGELGVAPFADFIQTDAAINVGNSGGALINTEGELVGINTAVVASASLTQLPPEGIGFAIPVNLVRGVMAQLLEHGRVIRGYLGLNVVQMSAEETAPLGLEGSAVRVLGTNGPAAAAGLMVGDVLTHLNGERIYTRQQALNLIASAMPGDRVAINVVRSGGLTVEMTAILIERSSEAGS